MNAAQLMEMIKEKGNPIQVIFENNMAVTYLNGAERGNVVKFGKIEIVDTYEEKYLLAYAIIDGKKRLNVCLSKETHCSLTVIIGENLF